MIEALWAWAVVYRYRKIRRSIEEGLRIKRHLANQWRLICDYISAIRKIKMSNPITPEMLAKSGTESGHARALMCWAAMNIDKYPELKWLTHIPNGGYRDRITANNLKAEGVKSGVPDYLLAIKRGQYNSLWIELKRSAGKGKRAGVVSEEQQEWISHLIGQNFLVYIAYGWQDAKATIEAYLNYMKE